ncbi:diguanylate cyclase/phosphodiesterase [Marinomonas aquiplantarum]|uniref:Diguanylate cyclase/phosphodiesterase n=2 Tax=Marinomonas aquiplantarum TaxID=491951 RepID=A0A366CVZ8_9GAMM|nr:diguanylate cyclase/phosphodiesterase [Marinomonas aquiplantarum]
MLIDSLKQYFFIDSNHTSGQSEGSFQLSILRILIALTISIFFISELHSVFTHGELFFFEMNSLYLCVLFSLLYFSKKYSQSCAFLFVLSLVLVSGIMLFTNPEKESEKYALIALYSIPLITRLLFSFKASLVVMTLNLVPFYFVTTQWLDSLPANESSSFYFQLLTFMTLNIGLPLAVSQIIHALENHSARMRALYRKLNENYLLYEEFFENTGTPTLLCDQRGVLIKANQLAKKLLGQKDTTVFSGTRMGDWLSPLNNESKLFWQSNKAECTLKHSTDTHIQVRRASLTNHGHYILHLDNMTEFRAIQQKLESTQQTNSRLAHFDLLTLLPNHLNFCRQVNMKINEQEHHLTGAMFIIRISQFKLLNKQYGKDNANKIILSFSKALQNKLSKQAIVGRLRGIKFACFVPLSQTHLIQKNLTTLIQSLLPAQLMLDGQKLNMDYQLGISYYHTDGKTAEELLEHCEMALEYSTSTDKFSFYNHNLESKLVREHNLGLKLSAAIKNKKIDIWLQPQVSANGEVRSFEALARWNNEGEFVSPMVFIKLAEDLGMLPLLAENLVRELVDTLTVWHKEHIKTPIALNLAGQELMNDAFFALLMTLIADNPWLSEMLELEITETSSVMTHPLIHKRLRSLSQYGYSIAIDDFGTGQASLGQLVDIPANILKIDRRFVSPLPQDQRHVDIVKSTIQLANSLNMQVIAEGIETKEQATLLIALGCHTLQGYYYAKPSPLSDWTANGHEKAKQHRMVY